MTGLSEALDRRRFALPESVRSIAHVFPPHRVALAAILFLAAFLRFFQLDREGYSNPYYAATVRSMLTGWHAFFFASYDAGGFVTVDKPPLGFWIQAATATVFGFSGFSLLLPQALAGIASVAVLYHLVRRVFGVVAGLVAALVLALMPVTVATDRNNTPDALLVLFLLLAAWAVMLAIERGRLRWLLVGAVLVGLAFNVKMLQAYLAVPALWLAYLVGAPLGRRVRLAHLGAATLVLLVVSLAWAVAVDLTPAERRPYVGSSRSNSVLELIVGYNGLGRLFGLADLGGPSPAPAPGGGNQGPGSGGQGSPGQGPPAQIQPPQGQAPQGPQVVFGGGPGAPGLTSIGGENGEPGALRLFNFQLAGQVSWLIPLALVGGLAALWPWRRGPARLVRRWRPSLGRVSERVGPSSASLVLWGTWFLTCAVFFSVAGFWHRYYLVVLAPAVAALVAIALVGLWRDYHRPGRRGWLLPAALAGTALAQVAFLAPYEDWARWLSPVIVAVSAVNVAILVLARMRRGPGRARPPQLAGTRWRRPLSIAAVAIALGGLLLAPATWAAVTVANAPGDALPAAGPRPKEGGAPGGPGGLTRFDGGEGVDRDLLRYLLANRRDERFLVATPSSSSASPIIIETGQAVMALGGFGGDRILDADGVARAVANGTVRYFLLDSDAVAPPGGAPGNLEMPQDDVTKWVREHCQRVPESAWRSDSSAGSGSSDSSGGSGPAGSAAAGPGSGPTRELWDCGALRS